MGAAAPPGGGEERPPAPHPAPPIPRRRRPDRRRSKSAAAAIARLCLGAFLALYAAATFAWQHRHLSRVASAAGAGGGGGPAKDAFVQGGEQSGGRGGARWKDVANYRPASSILSDPTVPSWIGEYAAFHARQRRRYLAAKRRGAAQSASSANGTTAPLDDDASDVKFLISRCLNDDKCGGASDRLQDMPYNLLLANRTNRVLLAIWEKPARLEHYLVPPSGGIDWTIDDELRSHLDAEGSWNWKRKEDDKWLKIVSTTRRDSAAPIFRKYENEEVGRKIYHEIFRLMFAPSRALAERVEKTMTSLDLVPSQYSSVHLRVKYPVRGVDEHTFTFRKHKSQIVQWATNAVNCAAELHPNSTIYVSSDNNDTVGYLLEESHFARHYVDATRHKKHPLVVRLVARDYSDENHHVAFSRETEGDSFMGVFEDLTIMGMGRCVAHGLGGYGRLGAALSGGECAVAHRGRNSRVCSDALAKMQSKIDA